MMTAKSQHNFRQISPRTWSTVGSSGNIYTLHLAASTLRCNCSAAKHGYVCDHVKQLTHVFKADLNQFLVGS